MDTPEPDASDCSSLSGSEELVDAEQLSECPNSLVGQDQRYLSSLRFSISCSIDNDMSHDMKSNSPADGLKNYALSFVQSYHKEKTSSHIFVPPGLRESNFSCMSNSQIQIG